MITGFGVLLSLTLSLQTLRHPLLVSGHSNNDPDAADLRFLNLMQPRRKQLSNNRVSHFTAKEPARRSMSPRYEVYI
ncbi:hypothetical protein QL093DRAFT_2404733 [Fusarium oxysporum]|nr:hypothetical protein QL093DRAFT_2404733 [Fusarium oxysporum]